MESLRRDAESELRAKIAPADLLLLDTFEVVKIVEESFEPAKGQPGKTLTLNMQVEFSAQYVAGDELKTLSLSTLNSSVEDGFEAADLPTYRVITEPSTDGKGVSHFELEVTRILLRQVESMEVFSIVRGHQLRFAQKDLTAILALRKAPTINMTPEWWPWMPLIPFNLLVEVK